MSKKKYDVYLPITGIVLAEGVEAESEGEAIEAALMMPLCDEQIQEWEVHKQVCEGNVVYGPLSRAYAEEEQ